MEKKVELLAPAGDWDAFVAAMENGADAVYLGGKLFNARQSAGNFDNEQLKKAIDYAHVRDASIYLTMNTLMSDSELGQAMDFTGEAYSMGIDGIIVQDMGFAGMIKEIFPELPMHASTQMTIHNLQGVQLLEKLGFSRVVLARELSVEEIAQIAKNTTMEIETFIHGALCISYSGQCLMSSIIGGRSGNRGKCAQPCRLPYELNADGKCLDTKGKYLLSPKDMCSVYDLGDIIGAGVKSLKIEGRMKNPEYVATVVRIYRKYVDRAIEDGIGTSVEPEDERELTQIFNRGGLSRGYLTGKTGSDMMCYEKPKNWGIYLGDVISYDAERKTVKLKLHEELSLGDGVEVWNGENESPGALISEIRHNNGNRTTAYKGETVTIGNIKGRISKGNKVYKTSDKRLNTQARESYSGKTTRKVILTAGINVKKDQPVILTVADENNNIVSVKGERLVEAAINRPLTEVRVKEQIEKTGASPFKFSEIEVHLEEGVSLPISELNDIRRRALDELEHKRSIRYVRDLSDMLQNADKKISHFPGNSRKVSEKAKISLHFGNVREDFDFSKIDVDRVYLPFSWMISGNTCDVAEKLHDNCEVFIWIPAITRGNYDKLIEARLAEVISKGIDGIMVGNPGVIERIDKSKGVKIFGDYSLNVFNTAAMLELQGLGLEGATVSPELNLGQIRDLGAIEGFMKEVMVYGRIPVMTSEYCPVGSLAGGHTKDKKCNVACRNGIYKLKDRMGMEFPVSCDRIDCRSMILNSNVLFVLDSLEKINKAGSDMIRLNITDEEPEEINRVIDMHKDVLANGVSAVEKYHKEIQKIKDRGFTKGHFYRGV